MARSAIPLPADFAETQHLRNDDLEERYGVCKDTLRKWRARLGITRQRGGKRRAPVPVDFATIAPNKTLGELAEHYQVSKSAAARWCSEAGVRPGPFVAQVPCPADFVERAASMTLSELERHYGRTWKIIVRWCKQSGAHPRPYVKPLQTRRQRQPKQATERKSFTAYIRTPSLPNGREEEAAQHLRRHYVGVYRCSETGAADRDGKFWRCGATVLTCDELVERAERKGFDPDGWMRLPQNTAFGLIEHASAGA